MFEGNGTQIEFGPISVTDKPSLTRYVLEKEKTVYIPDCYAKDSEYPREKMIMVPGHDEKTILGVPLMLRNETIGALFLQAKEPNSYDENQVRLVETIANQASIAMDNAQLCEKVQNMAITDSLTGAYNRRYFYEFADNEIARSKRYQKNLAIIMVDIDHFKMVNDKFGHIIGDQTLKMVVDTIASQLRQVDVLCRFGGEEFVVLMPETSLESAFVAAERICRAISMQTLKTEEGDICVTVSIGVTQLRNDNQTMMDLVNEADQALYTAKEEGRNCVRVFTQKPDTGKNQPNIT
jgi:diguanylate cyclase (GGDEF)-like protein